MRISIKQFENCKSLGRNKIGQAWELDSLPFPGLNFVVFPVYRAKSSKFFEIKNYLLTFEIKL